MSIQHLSNIITGKQEYNITVYTENQIGLLNRIAIIFTRRKINIVDDFGRECHTNRS
jgi:acetolactate synthase-1/3 small subunit